MLSNLKILIHPTNQLDKKKTHLHLSANKESDPMHKASNHFQKNKLDYNFK